MPDLLLPGSMDEAIVTALNNHPRLNSAHADVLMQQ
jgi:hypothetical protein